MNSFSAFEMKTLPFYLILCYFYLPSINSKTCVTTISQNIDTLISYPTNISYNFLTFYRRLSFSFHEFAIYKNSCTIEFLIDWRKSFLSYLFIIIEHFLTQYLIDKIISNDIRSGSEHQIFIKFVFNYILIIQFPRSFCVKWEMLWRSTVANILLKAYNTFCIRIYMFIAFSISRKVV